MFHMLLFQQFANVQDILGLADEGSGNEVDVVIQAEADIIRILLSDPREPNFNTRGVNTLLGTNVAVVLYLRNQFPMSVILLGDLQINQAIIDQNVTTHVGIIVQTGISNRDLFWCAFQTVIHGNANDVASVGFEALVLLGRCPNLGTLGIQHDTNQFAGLLFGFMHHVHPSQMLRMITMGEVEPENICAGLDQFRDQVNRVTCRS